MNQIGEPEPSLFDRDVEAVTAVEDDVLGLVRLEPRDLALGVEEVADAAQHGAADAEALHAGLDADGADVDVALVGIVVAHHRDGVAGSVVADAPPPARRPAPCGARVARWRRGSRRARWRPRPRSRDHRRARRSCRAGCGRRRCRSRSAGDRARRRGACSSSSGCRAAPSPRPHPAWRTSASVSARTSTPTAPNLLLGFDRLDELSARPCARRRRRRGRRPRRSAPHRPC